MTEANWDDNKVVDAAPVDPEVQDDAAPADSTPAADDVVEIPTVEVISGPSMPAWGMRPQVEEYDGGQPKYLMDSNTNKMVAVDETGFPLVAVDETLHFTDEPPSKLADPAE